MNYTIKLPQCKLTFVGLTLKKYKVKRKHFTGYQNNNVYLRDKPLSVSFSTKLFSFF